MKNPLKIILLIVSTFILILSCSKDDTSSDTTEPNYDMPTILVGTQEWMQTNLDVTTYRNGDEIPEVTNHNEWIYLTTGAWCYYENNSENGKTYGKLYNWYAVNDPRGLAPSGWHVPSDAEWTALIDYLGGNKVAGGKMKATTNWSDPNTDANNSSGFTGLPGGFRFHSNSIIFASNGFVGYWWSSSESEYSKNSAGFFYMDYDSSSATIGGYDKTMGLSVRCLKD